MRKFYEEWQMLDANLSVITDKLQKSNSATAVAELQNTNNQIDIHKIITIPDVKAWQHTPRRKTFPTISAKPSPTSNNLKNY
jgi:hypothetical protein